MNPPGRPASATTSRTPTRVNQVSRQPPNRSFVRRNLARLPASFWKGLVQYVIGFGLLAVILYLYWDAKPGKPTDEQKALSMVAGAAVDVEAQRSGTRPGLVEAFSRPINPWPL